MAAKMMTMAYFLDKYGPRLTVEQVAHEMGWSEKSVYEMLARGEFPIPSYREGKRRWVSYQAVAEY